MSGLTIFTVLKRLDVESGKLYSSDDFVALVKIARDC